MKLSRLKERLNIFLPLLNISVPHPPLRRKSSNFSLGHPSKIYPSTRVEHFPCTKCFSSIPTFEKKIEKIGVHQQEMIKNSPRGTTLCMSLRPYLWKLCCVGLAVEIGPNDAKTYSFRLRPHDANLTYVSATTFVILHCVGTFDKLEINLKKF